MAIPGKGFNLLLKTTGSIAPTAGVLVVQDASSNNTASIRLDRIPTVKAVLLR
jgi:hypothetical protein